MYPLIYFQSHALLNRIENATSENERKLLREISSKQKMSATLLPIKSVGVQVCIILSTLILHRAIFKAKK